MAEQTAQKSVKDRLAGVVDALSPERQEQVLAFALFVKAREAQQRAGTARPLDDLWGDFWPEDESVDEFIETVRRWRREDVALHKDLL